MNRIVLIIIFLLSSFQGFTQNSSVWKGYFSYNSIKDISKSEIEVVVASENAYFKKNTNTNAFNTVTTIEGLSGQIITQIYYSEAYKKTIIGHEDGLLIVVNETDGSVLNVVDIVNKVSVPSDKKRINHFYEFNGKLYISTDFGLSTLDLATSEFGDTYFIGPNGSNIEIFQTTILNNTIYTVAKGYGVLSASVSNPNLVDFNQWTMMTPGNWKGVETISDKIILIDSATSMYSLIGNTPSFMASFSQIPVDFRVVDKQLVIVTQNYVYVYDEQLANSYTVNNSADATTMFTCAILKDEKLYIGTQNKGLITTSKVNTTDFVNTTPNGPIRNKIFGVKSLTDGFWAVYGDYTSAFNPYPLDALAVSKYDTKNGWLTIPYQDLLGAKSISSINIKPNDEKEIYFSSFYSGLLKFKNDIPEVIYNASNSSLRTIEGQVPDDIRVGVSSFDKNQNLWMTTSVTKNSIHVLKTSGQWQSYALPCVEPSLLYATKGVLVDRNNTKWVMTRIGAIGFNENSNKCIIINEKEETGAMPSRDVRTLAIDKNNKLWIGTIKGLRVLPSVDSFLTQQTLEPKPVIIMEDGLAQELLYQQLITDIVVDGANNKWIGTAGSGVFYISSDGQKTFNIFTKENSPLPSNTINDIEINEITGEVFIATEAGMVSYKGNATAGAEDLKNVVVFPNPVRPNFTGEVSITGLMDKCNVKITDVNGNLVYEAIAQGGTIQWDTKAFGKYKVASGVYIVHISSEDGVEVETKKIMIIR